MSPTARLRQLARPFVVRQLRGQNFRRTLGLSALFAILTVLLGAWLALGRGSLERDFRVTLGVERDPWELYEHSFTIVCFDDPCYSRDTYSLRQTLLLDLAEALRTYDPVRHADHEVVYERAREYAPLLATLDREPMDRGWAWDDTYDRRRLLQAISIGFEPRMIRYESPLGWREALAVIGMLATALVVALATIVGPVLTGISVAQESHDNTLSPITGTGLGGREIAAGLMLGAFAPVALVAAPQLAIAAAASLVAGHAIVVLGVLVHAAACGWALAMIAALVGLYAGRRRGPGPVGIALLALTGTWMMVGLGIGLGESLGTPELAASVACPSVTLVLGTREAFFDIVGFRGVVSGLEFVACAILPWGTAIVLGMLGLRAAGRRVEDRAIAPLSQGEALIGALVASLITVFTTAVLFDGDHDGGPFASLAMFAAPLMVLVVSRVTATQGESQREVDVAARLRELAVFVAIQVAVVLAVMPGEMVETVPGLLHVAWALVVLALAGLRLLCPGNRWLVGMWVGFCWICAATMLGSGAAFAHEPDRGMAFVMFEISPVLGAIQLVLIVAIPLLLLRATRRSAKA